VIDMPMVWVDMLHNGGTVKYIDGFFTANGILADESYNADSLKTLFGPLPSAQSISAIRPEKPVRELIRAWDPIKQKVVWEHETSSGSRGYDGGILSTAGNLVFQGRGTGELWLYAADTGKVLKVISTGSHIMAAPMAYSVNGEEYVAVQVGYGGAAITFAEIPVRSAARQFYNANRIISFKLGGREVPKPPLRVEEPFAQPPPQMANEDTIRSGEKLFIQECSRCHQFGPSITPDLRKLNPGLQTMFKDIVLHGAVAPTGMERFDDVLSESDVDAIHAYLIDEGWKAYKQEHKEAVN
jgi:quinohemoprotein ethanol dehydrogenase